MKLTVASFQNDFYDVPIAEDIVARIYPTNRDRNSYRLDSTANLQYFTSFTVQGFRSVVRQTDLTFTSFEDKVYNVLISQVNDVSLIAEIRPAHPGKNRYKLKRVSSHNEITSEPFTLKGFTQIVQLFNLATNQ